MNNSTKPKPEPSALNYYNYGQNYLDVAVKMMAALVPSVPYPTYGPPEDWATIARGAFAAADAFYAEFQERLKPNQPQP